METKDLDNIKKWYGEEMAHLCRELFPSILSHPGMLSSILTSSFAKTRSLVKDIKQDEEFLRNFKRLIDSKAALSNKKFVKANKTVEELFDEAGYILYPECQTNEDIQEFKKYYKEGERLCTFRDPSRINRYRIWFAVKKNVDEIKHAVKPKRDDEYGTSVLCLQFFRDEFSTLSIKNRYNHMVGYPDDTLNSDLEKIIPGLTDAFINQYKINLLTGSQHDFSFPHYIMGEDGRHYRFNYEIGEDYFCENNVIVDEFRKVHILNTKKAILCDYFIVNMQRKTIRAYDEQFMVDSFADNFDEIEKITVQKRPLGLGKIVTITPKGGKDVVITLDTHGRIDGLTNHNLQHLGDYFLYYNQVLKTLDVPNVVSCGDSVLYSNEAMEEIAMKKVRRIGDDFMPYNTILKSADFTNLTSCGECFLRSCEQLSTFNAKKLISHGEYFLSEMQEGEVKPTLEGTKQTSQIQTV